MADISFRVLLDLTELHLESIKYVWINVSPQELKTIADFKDSVIRKINLDTVDIKLFVRNGLLLEDETVMILRENDTVKIHYVNDKPCYSRAGNHVIKSKKSSRKRSRSESSSDLAVNAKKCKKIGKSMTQESEDLNLIEMSTKSKKKQKQSSSSSKNRHNQSKACEYENYDKDFCNNEKETTSKINKADCDLFWNCDSFYSFDIQDSVTEKHKEKANKNVGSDNHVVQNSGKDSLTVIVNHKEENDLENLIDINSKTNSSVGISNNCLKKKRKRRKKHKEVLEPVGVVEPVAVTEINKEFKSFTNEADKSVLRKHVIYSSPSSSVREDIQLDMDCSSQNKTSEDLMPNTFVFEESVSNIKVKPNNYPRISTPTQSEFCKSPQWSSSLMQQKDLKSHQNEKFGFKEETHGNGSYIEQKDKQCISSNNFENKKLSELDYTNLPTLNHRPDIGAHLAYKILELDEHYNPVISGFREGIVKDINLDNEEIEIELLTHEIKPARTGKFENLKNDEVPLPEIKRSDIVTWSALVEPKLIAS